MAIIFELLLVALFISGILVYGILRLIMALLRVMERSLSWLYEAIKPVAIELWEEWQCQQIEARKPQDIREAGESARNNVDEIMAQYRQQIDEILNSVERDGAQLRDIALNGKVIFSTTTYKSVMEEINDTEKPS